MDTAEISYDLVELVKDLALMDYGRQVGLVDLKRVNQQARLGGQFLFLGLVLFQKDVDDWDAEIGEQVPNHLPETLEIVVKEDDWGSWRGISAHV